MTADKEEQLLSNLLHMKTPKEKEEERRGDERKKEKKCITDSVMFILLYIYIIQVN